MTAFRMIYFVGVQSYLKKHCVKQKRVRLVNFGGKFIAIKIRLQCATNEDD